VVVEYTYSHYGERGAIDVVGWHATLGVIVVVEVKTRIYDVQALLSSLDRKTRLAAQLLPAERGWRMRGVGRVVVVPETTANRSLVARHESVFHAALPDRSRRVRGWLRKPSGTLAGIWFLSVTNRVGDNHVAVGRQRVRLRRPRSSRGRDIA